MAARSALKRISQAVYLAEPTGSASGAAAAVSSRVQTAATASRDPGVVLLCTWMGVSTDRHRLIARRKKLTSGMGGEQAQLKHAEKYVEAYRKLVSPYQDSLSSLFGDPSLLFPSSVPRDNRPPRPVQPDRLFPSECLPRCDPARGGPPPVAHERPRRAAERFARAHALERRVFDPARVERAAAADRSTITAATGTSRESGRGSRRTATSGGDPGPGVRVRLVSGFVDFNFHDPGFLGRNPEPARVLPGRCRYLGHVWPSPLLEHVSRRSCALLCRTRCSRTPC